MIVKLLTEHHLEFLSLKGGCIDPSESTNVKMSIVGNLMHWLISEQYKLVLTFKYMFLRSTFTAGRAHYGQLILTKSLFVIQNHITSAKFFCD